MLASDHLFLHAYRLASRSLAGLLAALGDTCREAGVGQIFSPFKNISVRAAPNMPRFASPCQRPP